MSAQTSASPANANATANAPAAITSIRPWSLAGEYERQRTVVEQLLARVRTAYLARVVAARQNGAIEGAGTVDVQPLAGQLDGAGNVIAHGVIYGIPYLRLAGGANAVILDPQAGDIGLVAVCDRDHSSVIANAGAAAPGSLRRHDMSDSVYVTTVLGATPQQYVAFTPDGIDIVSPSQIRLAAPVIVLQAQNAIGLTAGTQITDSAPGIELDGAITQGEGPQGGAAKMAGPLTVQQDVTAAGTSVHGHDHHDSCGGTTSAPL
ncbi:Gp138 family membrane-puncturing spike protein [Paraburkholderia sp. J10-1]|uniref:Gp138 family membrane-puncturing spike protein n=1 Tax=Paraburkholderia sp. J10-1 TaxID=2805430 RepID=UPI002AB6E347|nr:Gp138 family membrane-puncturing spike protein [Paraburkholderia sp. J10-1]